MSSRNAQMLPVMGGMSVPTGAYPASGQAVSAFQPDVAVLVYDLRASGVVRNALRIARRAAVAGLRCDVVVVHANGDFRPFDHPLLRLVALMPDASANRFLGTLAAAAPLRAYLRQRRPRVLFSAGNHIHPLAAMACFRLANAPRLIMRASNDISHARRNGWESALARVLAVGARPLLRAMFLMADRIVSVSEELAADLGQRLSLPKERINVVSNGIDVGRVAHLACEVVNHPWFAPGEPPVIVGIGRLHRQKNFPLLIRAFAQLRQAQPARLMILGTGTVEARQELLELAARLGVADDVELTGYVENPFAYLRRASLFVLSSSWEGMSNALLEAMACGCPVVATRCPTGTVEVLDEGRYGPLVEIENAEALAEAMAWRLAQPRQSAQLVARAQEYDLSRALEAYADLLTEEVRGPDDQPPSLSAAA
ncbi:glycosyltransferase [Pedomonas mirosovicensis]|uniref:glycosyltransferase n=1 Tax=Pedomonas mirosovicensis TaxID=2908641 RepID=UPI0021695531|nr:glycosyltransferase [Pedomonas mirosovicensis]MCH8684984.1 glycosyltransferase [Pedomonas mirosovicensis]